MVSDDEGAHAAPKRLARAKRADSPVSTVSTAISTAAATVSAVASTATASNTGSEGLGWAGLGDGLGPLGVGDGMIFRCILRSHYVGMIEIKIEQLF